MINFSVSRPGTMSKPMCVCENKKQSPQNKHAYPYTHTCNPTFCPHDSHKKAIILLVNVFTISALSVSGIGLKKEEEEERERPFLFTSSSRRREKLNKGRDSGKRPPADSKLAKAERTEVFFFFFSPGPENQCARRTRNRQINHCALRQFELHFAY